MSFQKILPVKPAAKKAEPVRPAPAKPAPKRKKPQRRRPIGG